jgi:hypothetical protein
VTSQSSRALAVKTALHAAGKAAYAAADETAVDVSYGFRWPIVNNDYVSFLGGETEYRIVPEMGLRGPSLSQQDATVHLDVEFGAWRPGHLDEDDQAVQERVFALYGILVDHLLTNDPTLGGLVVSILPESEKWDGATTGEETGWGRIAVIAARFVAPVRIR